ncbi:DNA alkylation repair protein [Candidatus Woesearchaeota archaeon]|jgi:3-methyladenine DNA glycosylase AlkD|nr:DNA alkylation repair protein [Candidatus Woesearchaeota archaeon]MBT7402264.1 DNA alkylation repair protein [Candidatus Woesearchaeota archaeon]
MIEKLKQDVQELANPERAEHSKRYFKTGPGQYGEGDVFLGLTMPQQREIAKKYKDLQLEQVQELLESGIHTYRMIALVILTLQYKNNNEEIFNFYLKNTKYINNWDLVDVTTHKIVGEYLLDKPRDILYKLAKSPDLWEKRISIISTFAFIRRGQLDDAINIAEILLHDKHDLIHKAVGWMLREVGKKDKQTLTNFLDKYSKVMPRTMLRYSIERFTPEERQFYMKK